MFSWIWYRLRVMFGLQTEHLEIDVSEEDEETKPITSEVSVQATMPPPNSELEIILKNIQDQHKNMELNYGAITTIHRESLKKQNEVITDVGTKLDYYVETLNNTTLKKEVNTINPETNENEVIAKKYEASLEEYEQKFRDLEIRLQSSKHYINSHKTAVFNGFSNFTNFKYELETAAKRNAWSDETTLLALVMLLRPLYGMSTKILNSLYESLEIHYGDKYKQYAEELKTRAQRPDESLEDWAVEIDKLVHLAYPWATELDDVVIRAFIEGLYDPFVKYPLKLGHHETLEDALKQAKEQDLISPKIRFAHPINIGWVLNMLQKKTNSDEKNPDE